MLVIVSDLHLTDGGFSGTLPAMAFRIFRERLRDMAYDASWRQDGTYRPVEELHLVLLGDVLDMIRSERWPSVSLSDPGYVRPWSEQSGALFRNKVCEVADSILNKNCESLQVLQSLTSGGVMTLPPATPSGGVARVSRDPEARERVPVNVRIHYMVGNHDWFLHLPGEPFDAVRARVASAMCLATPPGRPFPYDPGEDPELAQVCAQHRAWFRHGDFFDSTNFEGRRDASSIGDAIVIDLVNRFGVTIERELAGELPRECLDGLRQIDYVRPLLVVPVWIDGLLRRTCPDSAARKVKDVWNRLADEFLEIPYVRAHGQEKLALALKFSRTFSLRHLSDLFSWLGPKIPGNDRPTCQDALAEEAFRSRSARSIVYGHTHHHEIVPLDVSTAGEGPLHQAYLNSGTWRLVHELAVRDRDAGEFMSYCVMSYLGFYQGDERGGRPFEAWSGALALPGA